MLMCASHSLCKAPTKFDGEASGVCDRERVRGRSKIDGKKVSPVWLTTFVERPGSRSLGSTAKMGLAIMLGKVVILENLTKILF